ncbi:MAG: type III-B CRISPR module-associated protein Cmr5 [Hydrogenobaculum sp.]|nr:MAG: type III-B CRISPR module-associated protein Cmr5 [Hydrogenobaculum sp.]HEK25155.1 type III-B CRISPR module-associated protein Cmr5 [Hydrogenobaculum sp.]
MTNNENLITALERGRAKFAYECVKEVLERNNTIQKEYRSYARKIPSMILSSGLGQALAFVYSKNSRKEKEESAYNVIYDQLSRYMKSDIAVRIRAPKDRDLIDWVLSCDSYDYKYATQEILSFFKWLRRFAEGMIKAED